MSFAGCPCDWATYRGSCYKFETSSRKSWDSARSACLGMSSDLVSITNVQEQGFITSITRKYGGERFWLGFNDKRVEGKFEWSDGSRVTYTYWNRREPNDNRGGEDCAELAGNRPMWNDMPCRHTFYFICKRRLGKWMLYELLWPPVRSMSL